jgi:hypothetical protein
MHVGELRSIGHLLHGDHPGRQLAQPPRGEPAHEVLDEDCEAFLGLVVLGEAGAQQSDRLVGPVDVGDDVGADLVLEERVHTRGRHFDGRCDQEIAVGHHHAAAVRSDLDVNVEVGVYRPVVVEFRLGQQREGLGIETIADLGRRLGDQVEQRLGVAEQCGADRPVELDAQLQEPGRVPLSEHLQLQFEFMTLRREEVGQVGVIDGVHPDCSDARLRDLGVVLERSVHELRGGAVAEERPPGVDQVDRGHVEEKSDARGGVREFMIDGQFLGANGGGSVAHVQSVTARVARTDGTTASRAFRS